MVFLYNNANLASISGPDDVYEILQQGLSGGVVQPGITNKRLIVGPSMWGPVNQVQDVSAPSQSFYTFGLPTTGAFDMMTEVANAQQAGVQKILGVRVTDLSDVAAILKATDAVGYATGTFTVTASSPAKGDVINFVLATRATTTNGAITLVSNGSSYNIIVTASGGFSIGDSIYVNDGTNWLKGTVTAVPDATHVTVTSTSQSATSGTVTTAAPFFDNPVLLSYTVTTADVNAATPANRIAGNIAAVINSSAAVAGSTAFLQPCVSPKTPGNTIIITASSSGSGGNTIVSQGAASAPTGVTLSPTTVTAFAGGGSPAGVAFATLVSRFTGSFPNAAVGLFSIGANSTPGSPTFTFSIGPGRGVPSEVFANIVAYVTAGGGYDAPTFITNLVAAINNGQGPQRPPSAFWIATAGASTAQPLLGVPFTVSTLGTNGDTFSNYAAYNQPSATVWASLQQLGSDSAQPKTGIYQFRNQAAGGKLTLAGNADPTTVGQALIAFGQSENCWCFGQYPTGYTTALAVNLQQQLALASPFLTMFKDFSEFTDSQNSVTGRRWPSAAFAADRACTTRSDISPANQPVFLVTGTERTSAYYGINQPYPEDEIDTLESAGINLITNNCPGGTFWGIRHNKNTLGKSSQYGNMAYTSMAQFLGLLFASTGGVLGQFVGKKQTGSARDPIRGAVRNVLTGVGQLLGNSSDPMIDLDKSNRPIYAVQCDQNNNPPQVRAAGQCVAAVQVGLGNIIDKLILTYTLNYAGASGASVTMSGGFGS